MQPLSCNIATLAVAFIFLIWRAYQRIEDRRRRRTLRERVALMLWVMAERVEGEEHEPSAQLS